MIQPQQSVWALTIAHMCSANGCTQFPQVHRFCRNWSQKKMVLLPCMGKHRGLHQVSGSRSFSERICIYDILHTNIWLRLAIKHKLRTYRSELSIDEAQIIENKRTRLQALINTFEHQANTFLAHDTLAEDISISSLGDYDEFDHPDEDDDMTARRHSLRAPDGSGMDAGNPEDIPILLPSSFGWKWCALHNAKSLAMKEAQLCHAQANDAIHQIRLALGFKSALFRTQVRPANTQQMKTRAWNAVHNVDSTLSEHARIYSMARDAYRKLRNNSTIKAALPPLGRDDLRIATLVLGSETTGQRNTQQSWIWSFGKVTADDGTWMDDCELSFAFASINVYRCAHILISWKGSLASCKGTVWTMVRLSLIHI